MVKLVLFLVTVFFLLPAPVLAAGPSFVSVVNPVRGDEFWDVPGSQPADAVLGQVQVLQNLGIPATWLLRFDALGEKPVVNLLPAGDEKGLFLEVTSGWAESAGVSYRRSESWHFAGSVFLTGYTPKEREKLIDTAFGKFKNVFGYYPKSVGSWWVDSYSLGYMQERYGISAALIVADQYTTDNYQIWGQYFSAPYYPAKNNTLRPAQSLGEKLPVVVMQWASRDPVNGYGKYVEDSTYSVQANDYSDYHKLGTDYFARLVDIYTGQKLNRFGALVVGLENSYSWKKYGGEYAGQMQVLDGKKKAGQLSFLTMKDFALWYGQNFSGLSPEQIVVAPDPLMKDQTAVWFMNPYYRAGWIFGREGSVIRDVRQYVEGEKEPCFDNPCEKLNFATFATRVLDEVTYGKRAEIDSGKISSLEVKKDGERYLLSYNNEAGRRREIGFLPRDISIDGRISSIDGFILQANTTESGKAGNGAPAAVSETSGPGQWLALAGQTVKFILFLIFALFIPGFLLVQSLKQQLWGNIFLSLVGGMVMLTLTAYLGGYLQVSWLVPAYLAFCLIIFIREKMYLKLGWLGMPRFWDGVDAAAAGMVVLGVIFQSLALFRSGWVYDFGVGFWGPLGHDGIWHQALVGQLLQHVPPQNPILAGEKLLNYHYFYDLLVAAAASLSQIKVADLVYRFFPALFSLLLGVGTYLWGTKISGSKIAALISLYFVYFAGSFGWIVEFIRERHLGGESAFWVNQPVSMNLNPPFAVSLLIVVAVLWVVQVVQARKGFWGAVLLIVLLGSVIEFKAYAGVTVLAAMFFLACWEFVRNRDFYWLKIFAGAILLSAAVFLPQNGGAGELLVLSPFWFIHSMVDFPDRVGWIRLASARDAYLARGDWLKFLGAESLALGIFIAGNLGLRLVALFSLVPRLRRQFSKEAGMTLLFLMMFISLGVPVFLIQKGNPWNTIQFMYYFLYLVAIFSGTAILAVFHKFPKILGWAAVVLVLLLAPVNAVVTFRSALYPLPPAKLSVAELEALDFLKKLPDGTVLTNPYDKDRRKILGEPFPLYAYETTAYVSAYSGKATFVEDEIQNEILQTDYHKRLVEARDFFSRPGSPLPRDGNGVRYVYLLKSVNMGVDTSAWNLEKVFENSEVLIFEVKS